MASVKQRALARAKELGAIIDEELADGDAIYLDAPSGHRFVDSELHSIVASYNNEPGDTKMLAWKSLLDDMRGGVEPCPPNNTEPNCAAYGCPAANTRTGGMNGLN